MEFFFDWGARYVKKIHWNGEVYGSYGFAFHNSDKDGTESIFTTQEEHQFQGFNAVVLENENVDTSSVVVRDISTEITYEVGVDYQIFRSGSFTNIARIPGSRILDGDTVLVDYRYIVPIGNMTDKRHIFGTGIRLWSGLVNPYFRFLHFDKSISGDDPTSEFLQNSGNSKFYGVRSTHTFKTLGNIQENFHVEVEKNDQKLYPFRALRFNGSVHLPIKDSLKLSLSASRSKTEYKKTEDDDLNTITGAVDAIYYLGRTRTSTGFMYEKSFVGRNKRKSVSLRALCSIPFREWSADLSIKGSLEEFGINEDMTDKERFLLKFSITRKF